MCKMNAIESKPKFNHLRDNYVSLAAIKTSIYNPALPTLRKIDRDDVLGKLSYEHSRHTTFLDKSTCLYIYFFYQQIYHT